MATFNWGKREILCKIVYYGPGLCGKTTNLQTIHAKVPSNIRGNLTVVATRQDRTLFFDMMPLDIGTVRGFKVRLQLYTVPGQVFYNASRKIVLKGVDGIVFVADSQIGKMEENVESLQNLADNLREIM
ncbi:MAG: GTPase domain-containing protein [Candidatus Electryoneaceae bacterium]|nr:GTPase domain-containing protein [Candidatus Electryoneaceae bacterium]